MLFNKDIDSHLLEFLKITQLGTYSILSKSTNKIFKHSKYYSEYISCKSYSLEDICKHSDINLLKKVLTEFQYTQEILDNILLEKCKKRQLDCVKFLIKNGANFKAFDKCAIKLVSLNGYLEVIKFLIGKEINCKIYNDQLFRKTSVNGHLKVAKFLINNRVNYKAKK